MTQNEGLGSFHGLLTAASYKSSSTTRYWVTPPKKHYIVYLVYLPYSKYGQNVNQAKTVRRLLLREDLPELERIARRYPIEVMLPYDRLAVSSLDRCICETLVCRDVV